MNKQMFRKLLAVAICVCATGCSGNTSNAQPGLIEEGKENDLISEEEAKKVALNQYGKTAFVSEISLEGYIYTAKVVEERYI
ncbi:MAG: hypothetical protein K2L08_01230, partial [Erysipelotrichaceae bacterium]|nr:hypothetical protein [Erysipelotrichaceae bacterium]